MGYFKTHFLIFRGGDEGGNLIPLLMKEFFDTWVEVGLLFTFCNSAIGFLTAFVASLFGTWFVNVTEWRAHKGSNSFIRKAGTPS